jgi:hypothetical protein
MKKKNTDTATIRYYKGVIRDNQAQLKNALARIKKLEEKIRKIPLASPQTPSNMQLFGNDDINLTSGPTTAAGGGFSADEIKDMITQWILNGELPIVTHDHTSPQTGGDAFANLGCALQ